MPFCDKCSVYKSIIMQCLKMPSFQRVPLKTSFLFKAVWKSQKLEVINARGAIVKGASVKIALFLRIFLCVIVLIAHIIFSKCFPFHLLYWTHAIFLVYGLPKFRLFRIGELSFFVESTTGTKKNSVKMKVVRSGSQRYLYAGLFSSKCVNNIRSRDKNIERLPPEQ